MLYAKRWEGASVEDLQREVERRNIEPWIGHAAMIGDFVRIAYRAKGDLDGNLYMEHVPAKIKARRAARKVAEQALTTQETIEAVVSTK